MRMTHRRARRQYEYMESIYDESKGVLFPIVQGGTNKELRQESVEVLSEYAKDGIAVGGVSVGEPQEKIQEVVAFT